jgi:hypothetical protein
MSTNADLLDDVLARLDALERRNADLERDNVILKSQHEALLAREERRSEVAEMADTEDGSALERLSRRWVLRRALQAGAAGVAAGVLLQRDERTVLAGHTNTDVYANLVSAHALQSNVRVTATNVGGGSFPVVTATSYNTEPAIEAEHTAGGVAVHAVSAVNTGPSIHGENTANGVGVEGSSVGGIGVYGGGSTGVEGRAPLGKGPGVKGTGSIGVWGSASEPNHAGVYGENTGTTAGWGVVGQGVGNDGIGVEGRNATGYGVRGTGRIGVHGTSVVAGQGAIYGQHLGPNAGYGVIGDVEATGAALSVAGVLGRGQIGVHGRSQSNGYGAVWGEHSGAGYGIVGDAAGQSTAGVLGRNALGVGVRGEGTNGLYGKGASTGYGVVAQGGKAQMRLLPKSRAGKPTTGYHQQGELYLDSAGTLFICTASGTPGTWRKVSTTAV